MNLKIYVLVTSDLCKGRPPDKVVNATLQGGATAIQLREKNLLGRELVDLALKYRQLTHQYGALFIVNDRLDIALAAGADGVHLGQDDIPASVARRLLGPDKIIGVSVANAAEARKAREDGADYVGLGPFFPTESKTDVGEPVDLDTLREVKGAVDIPVVAIGGIKVENAAVLCAAGADGVAVISAVVGAPDIKDATTRLVEAVQGKKLSKEGE
ncbi:MAG: thiamine phosphate synthase [Firmicutes bacterium]|nr:thiamine phosphate synthase [Bacillota bacterium]